MCSSEGGPALGLGGESDAIDLVSEDDPMQALPGGTQICGKRQLAAVTLVLASLAPRPGTGTIVCSARYDWQEQSWRILLSFRKTSFA